MQLINNTCVYMHVTIHNNILVGLQSHFMATASGKSENSIINK